MGNPDLRVRVVCFLVAVTCLLLVGCGGKSKEAGDLNSLLRTGQQQMQKGRYREAVATFEKARSLNPEAPEPYLRLALVYEECLRDPETALRYYYRYQQVEKDEVKKEEILGWIAELERENRLRIWPPRAFVGVDRMRRLRRLLALNGMLVLSLRRR